MWCSSADEIDIILWNKFADDFGEQQTPVMKDAIRSVKPTVLFSKQSGLAKSTTTLGGYKCQVAIT